MLQYHLELIFWEQAYKRISNQVSEVSTDIVKNSRVDVLDFEKDLYSNSAIIVLNVEVFKLSQISRSL